MQSLESANDEIDFLQLGFSGDVTDFEEEVEVEICDGETETDIVETQTLENQTVGIDKFSNFESASLDGSTEDTDHLKEQQQPAFCIQHKLKQIFQEELLKPTPPPFQCLRRTSHLIEKLVAKESFNMVVVTLYPLNKGYCLCVCTVDGATYQESRQPYTQDLLLNYLDNEELPPTFLSYWEQTFPQLFYSGCVIAQVRDLRYGLPGQTRHVLLKPHTQSLINDINLLTIEDFHNWTTEEKVGLECALVNSVQGPLCLDPSPYAGLRRFHAHRTQHTFNTIPLKTIVNKQSQVSCSRKRKIDQTAVRCNHHLAQYISNKKPSHSKSVSINIQNKDSEINESLAGSDVLKDVNRVARALERPPESSECTPKLVEQYILETERPHNTTYHIKLTILQRPSNCEYLGHLYVDKEFKEGESNGASCRFSLGTRSRANNYIEQFKEIFTEEGRKSVRITHLVPGRPARVTCTDGMVEREAAKGSPNLRIHSHPKQKILQVLSGKSSQQLKVQKSQKDSMSGINLTLNGLLSSFTSASSSHQSNGNILNGEVPVTPVSSPPSSQVNNKASIMTNPAISALANSFRNTVQQYQQAAAAAAANTAVSSTASPSSGVSSSVVTMSTTTPSSSANKHSTAILTLLNNTGASNCQALNQLLSQPQQQKIVTRKMTITNLLNSRLRQSSPGNNSPSIRVPLSTLTSQLTSPPHNQTLNISTSNSNSIQPTISVQTLNSSTFRPLKQGSVQTLSNIQTLTGSLPSASGVQNLGSLQSVHRLSGTKDSSTSSGGQGVSTSNLGLSMPGLSALLAGTPSAEDPSPVERINNSSQPTSLNLTSLQASMASISGLQNVQVSIPGLPVPISVSLSVSSPHLVTASSLPSATMVSSNVSLGGPNTTATMVITNSNSAQLLTSGVKGGSNHQNIKPTSSSTSSLSGLQSIQLVGVPRQQRLSGNKNTLSARGVITAQRHVLKVAPSNTVRTEDVLHTGRVECGQVVTLPPHQQFQLALQKQSQLRFQQCVSQQPSTVAVKHRRRSSAADPKQ